MSIEFFLDGRAVAAEAGQTIMDVARENGINIPGLCGEKRISKTTSCFVCVVKDKKTGKFYHTFGKPAVRMLHNAFTTKKTAVIRRAEQILKGRMG